MERKEEIEMIAYQIWEEEGKPHGMDEAHWHKAEMIWESRNMKKPENKLQTTKTAKNSKKRSNK